MDAADKDKGDEDEQGRQQEEASWRGSCKVEGDERGSNEAKDYEMGLSRPRTMGAAWAKMMLPKTMTLVMSNGK